MELEPAGLGQMPRLERKCSHCPRSNGPTDPLHVLFIHLFLHLQPPSHFHLGVIDLFRPAWTDDFPRSLLAEHNRDTNLQGLALPSSAIPQLPFLCACISSISSLFLLPQSALIFFSLLVILHCWNQQVFISFNVHASAMALPCRSVWLWSHCLWWKQLTHCCELSLGRRGKEKPGEWELASKFVSR